jgi:hypothetical protein
VAEQLWASQERLGVVQTQITSKYVYASINIRKPQFIFCRSIFTFVTPEYLMEKPGLLWKYKHETGF